LYITIKSLTHKQLPLYAEVVRQSFLTVAADFGWTEKNAPGFVAFTVEERLLSKSKEEGYYPFGCFMREKIVGFVSLSDTGNGVYKLNQLSVLPEYRHCGYGRRLLDFCKEKVFAWSGRKIVLDIIEENTRLKNWYIANGFVHTGTRKFAHLPFTVGFMEWSVK
jgi:ribosomal protein S18 acetylase RimI-like enzyme